MTTPTPAAVTPTWLPWLPDGLALATRALGLDRALPPLQHDGATWRGRADAQRGGRMRKMAYELSDRGYTVRAFYEDVQTARIEITKGQETVRHLDYPAYKIWNIAAHFGDIVDDLLSAAAQGGANA